MALACKNRRFSDVFSNGGTRPANQGRMSFFANSGAHGQIFGWNTGAAPATPQWNRNIAARSALVPGRGLIECRIRWVRARFPGTGSLRSVKFLDQPECVFENWGKLKTAARERAKPLSAKNKFPLVIISPGAGMPRSAYTAYAQQLASDGFVVATVDFGSYGFLVSGNKALEEGPKEDNAGSAEIAAEDWAAHISELLDEISGKCPAVNEVEQAILKIVDLTRIAAMGHSIGGTASILACEKDSRFRACINADGGLDFTRLAVSGIRGTALFLRSHPLYSAADLAKRHRTQEEFDKMGKKALAETQALFSKSGGEAWVLSIDGTGHMSYSDAPYTMPTTISRFGGTIIEPGRLFKIIIRLMETYMEHEFDSSKPFQPNEFPELKLQVSRRQGK